MQFSILGVTFKCTKDMFTWEKTKWSFFTYWTIAWRVLALGLFAIVLACLILILPDIVGFLPEVPLGELGDDDSFFLIPTLKSLLLFGFWKEHNLITGIVLLVLLFITLILGEFYIYYYGIFKKNYTSFNRNYQIPTIPTLKSWNFWKRYIFVTILSLEIGFILGFVLDLLNINETIIQVVGFVVGRVLFHITLHGGSWGFVPTRKETIDTASTLKAKLLDN